MRIFFFFKQKTAYEVRISDWSSDVCSADLNRPVLLQFRRKGERHRPVEPDRIRVGILPVGLQVHARTLRKGDDLRPRPGRPHQIGRASRRDRVCQDVEISVVAVSLKKKGDMQSTYKE